MALANIIAKKQDKLYLGNLEPKRDWGFAPEYVEAMWKMLQQENLEEFVIGTGEAHSVREFLEQAFAYADLNFEKHLVIDPRYFRPTEVTELVADSSKAKAKLGWEPKIKFKELVMIMVDSDLQKIGLQPIGEGTEIFMKKFPSRWWKTD
jgi:GDPmannose 4,6-dehydratase